MNCNIQLNSSTLRKVCEIGHESLMMTKTITTLYLLLGLLYVGASTTYFDLPSYWLFAVKEDQLVSVSPLLMC